MAEAELSTVARPYARAAFSFALDQDAGLAKWSRMLSLLSAAANESVIQEALDNPTLSSEDEASLLTTLLEGELDESVTNFIQILSDYDRIGLLPTISEMFELLKSNHERTIDVSVRSAFSVSSEEESTLSEALTRRLQRQVNLETEQDESLLGGLVIKAEDTVIDNSVRGKLEKLAQVLN